MNSLYFVKELSPEQVVSFLCLCYKIKGQDRSSADKILHLKVTTDCNQKNYKNTAVLVLYVIQVNNCFLCLCVRVHALYQLLETLRICVSIINQIFQIAGTVVYCTPQMPSQSACLKRDILCTVAFHIHLTYALRCPEFKISWTEVFLCGKKKKPEYSTCFKVSVCHFGRKINI